jgi:hypothetical protein
MDVWFCEEQNKCREAQPRAAHLKEFLTQRVRRAFALLTQTYHGSPVTKTDHREKPLSATLSHLFLFDFGCIQSSF